MKQILLLFIISFSLSAQVKGVVKDSISGKPIAYVNIWVENENIGTTSEENGIFSLEIKEEKNIVFSALGYETKTLKSSEIETVSLVQKVYEMPEIVLEIPRNKKEIIIGDYEKLKLSSGVGNVGQENVHIWGKFIELNQKTEMYPYVKSIQFKTNCRLKNVIMRLRIFSVSKDGDGESDIVESDIIINIEKGTKDNVVDLSKYNIKIPKEGIIFGFEYLKLEQNRKNGSYEPSIKGFLSDYNNLVLLNKEGKYKYQERKSYGSVEIALKITLTN